MNIHTNFCWKIIYQNRAYWLRLNATFLNCLLILIVGFCSKLHSKNFYYLSINLWQENKIWKKLRYKKRKLKCALISASPLKCARVVFNSKILCIRMWVLFGNSCCTFSHRNAPLISIFSNLINKLYFKVNCIVLCVVNENWMN